MLIILLSTMRHFKITDDKFVRYSNICMKFECESMLINTNLMFVKSSFLALLFLSIIFK